MPFYGIFNYWKRLQDSSHFSLDAKYFPLSRKNGTGDGTFFEKYRSGIDIPVLGKVKVGGLTRTEAANAIQSKLRDEEHLLDGVVTINSYDQYITVLGEVKNPGRISINRDNMTILEAIGMAGDLNIQARRNRIRVIRQEGDQSRTYFVDIRSKDILNSPVYNLRQNDVIYVEPNLVKQGQYTNNDNSLRSISTWLSATSVFISLYILIFRD